MLDSGHSGAKRLVHVSCCIAGRIPFKLTFVKSRQETLNDFLTHIPRTQIVGDVVARELLYGHVQLVADIAPQSAEGLLVERRRLPLLHQSASLAQTLCGHLVCLLAAQLSEIRVVDSTLAEDDEQGDERDERQQQREPVGCGAEETLAGLTAKFLARLDRPDVLRLRNTVVGHGCSASGTLAYLQLKSLRLHRPIGIGRGVVVHELDRRNGVVALIAGNRQEVIHHIAFHTVGRQTCLIGHLCIIRVEILREGDDRLFDELQVTISANDHAQRDRVAGIHFRLVDLGRDIQAPHSTREILRARGQRVNLYRQARRNDVAFHLHIAGTAVEESLERIDIPVLLDDDALESDTWNLQLSRHLRIHHILAPGHTAIRAAVHLFHMEALLLRQRNLLRVEARQIGHLTIQLRQVNQCINLIGEQDRLLFVNAPLVRTHLDEQVVAGNLRTRCTHLRFLILMHVGSAIALPCCARHNNLRRSRGNGLSSHHSLGSRDVERTALQRVEGIGVGD